MRRTSCVSYVVLLQEQHHGVHAVFYFIAILDQWRSKNAGRPCSDICVWPFVCDPSPDAEAGGPGVTPPKNVWNSTLR